jgi:hypothetical protein
VIGCVQPGLSPTSRRRQRLGIAVVRSVGVEIDLRDAAPSAKSSVTTTFSSVDLPFVGDADRVVDQLAHHVGALAVVSAVFVRA